VSDRGLHRGIYASLLDDPDFQALSSNARLVLMTARLCAQNTIASIFRYYADTLAAQTGLTRRDLDRALAELRTARWVVYDAAVLWIRNGLRFDPNVRLDKDEKHRKGVERAVAALPRSRVVIEFCSYYGLPCPFAAPDGPPEGSPETHQEGSTETQAGASQEAPSTTPTRIRRSLSLSDPERADFDRFYGRYPRKRHRGDAEKAWLALAPSAELVEAICAAVERQAASLEWRSAPRFIPYPASWLRDKAWLDEPDPAAVTTPQTAENVRSLAGWAAQGGKP